MHREVDACLDVAVAIGVVDRSAIAEVYALSDETQAMLFVPVAMSRLTGSSITGCRSDP